MEWEQQELDRRHAAIMALELPIEERLWRSHNLVVPQSKLTLMKAFQAKLEGELGSRINERGD